MLINFEAAMSLIQSIPIAVKITLFFACFSLINAKPDKIVTINNSANGTQKIEPTLIINESKDSTSIGLKIGERLSLNCSLSPAEIGRELWWKKGDKILEDFHNTNSNSTANFEVEIKGEKDAGIYTCTAITSDNATINKEVEIKFQLTLVVPEVNITFIKAIGSSRVYMNWTIYDPNSHADDYSIEYSNNDLKKWKQYGKNIAGTKSEHVLDGLETNTAYWFRISGTNSAGTSSPNQYSKPITTLEKDPVWIPEIMIRERIINDSITISWTELPKKLHNYFHYYEIIAFYKNQTEKYKCPVESASVYKFINLETEPNNYRFQIRACSNYTKECNAWSKSTGNDILSFDVVEISPHFSYGQRSCLN